MRKDTNRGVLGVLRRSVIVRNVVGVLLFALLVFASNASGAQLIEVDQFCASAGADAGQCKNGEGVASNRTGAGGVEAGDVFVVERVNNRVQEFSKSGAFVRMWGKNVNSGGGTGFEVCTAAEAANCQAGTSSSEAAALNAPRGIAIDQETGNVYIANGENRRIEVYSAKGEFQGAFGWNVKVTGAAEEFQFCTEATGCQAGPSTVAISQKAGAFASLLTGAMAVDPETGNLWVGDAANLRINEFSFTLNGGKEVTAASFVRALGWNVNATTPAEELQTCTTASGCKQAAAAGPEDGRFNEPRGLAVDASGDVYAVSAGTECTVTTPCRIFKFNSDGSFGETFGPDTGGNEACQLTWTTDFGNDHGAFGLAVNPTDEHVFVAHKTGKTALEVCEFGPDGTLLQRAPKAPIPTTNATLAHQTLALGIEGRVYVQAPTEANDGWPVHILGLIPAAPAKVIGVSEITTESATPEGQITVPKPGGQGFDVAYHFEYSADNGFTWVKAPASDALLGTTVPGTYEVHEQIYGLKPNFTYRVRLVTTTSFTTTSEVFSFTTQKSGPTIVEQRPFNVTQTDARLQAVINPNGLPTTYHFEFGANPAFGIRIPADHELFAGDGSDPVLVSASVEGLQERSIYYFRVVAINSEGVSVGPSQRLETLNRYGLPDNRAPELVTPADKGAAGSISPGLGFQQVAQASVKGDSFVYPFANGTSDSTSGAPLRERAQRTASGWVSTQISSPSLLPPVRKGAQDLAIPSEMRFSSPDNGCGFIETFNPLTKDTSQLSVELGVTNLYRWNSDGSYDLITSQVPLNPDANDAQGGLYDRVEAADDCSRVFFQSDYELIPGASGLYEWEEGALRDAGVLKSEPGGPIGTKIILGAQSGGIPAYAVLGGQSPNQASSSRWNAVSPDGNHMFFTAIPGEGPSSGTPAIFMRTNGGADILEISASETGVPTNGARFEAASADGSHVFFRANYGIDAGASSPGPTNESCGPLFGETDQSDSPALEKKPCDLYVYDVDSGELTDLSATVAEPGAEIQGVVAASDDGSSVYFAALGQLVPGKGHTYTENVSGDGSANVYLAREGAPLAYVTTLADHDLLGPASATLMHRSSEWDAATSADGKALLFASSLNLTGWGNGGADKYAAYLFSADSGHIACVSCRPDGLESVALSGQSQWLLADPEQSLQPRSISIDGNRVYFSSPDVLATGAITGKRNVYQWEQGQVSFLGFADPGGLQGLAGYWGASDSGDDVFVASGESMVPQDTDSLSDVYDLRVDAVVQPLSVSPPSCQVDDSVPLLPNQVYCQGNPTPQPGSIPRGTNSSGGNVKSSSCPSGKLPRGVRCLSKRQIAQHRCHRVKGAKAKARCVRRQLQKLNRTESNNRGAAK